LARHLGGGADQHIEFRHIEERHPIEVNDQEGLPSVHPVLESGAERSRGGHIDGDSHTKLARTVGHIHR